MEQSEVRRGIWSIKETISKAQGELRKYQEMLDKNIEKDIGKCEIFNREWTISIGRHREDIWCSLGMKDAPCQDLCDLMGHDTTCQLTDKCTIQEHDDDVRISFEHNTPIEDCINIMKQFNIKLNNQIQTKDVDYHSKELKRAQTSLEEINSVIELVNEGE